MHKPGSNILLEKASEQELREQFDQFLRGETTVSKISEAYDVSPATTYRVLERLGYVRAEDGTWSAPPISLNWEEPLTVVASDYEELVSYHEPSEGAILKLLQMASNKLAEAKSALVERDERIDRLRQDLAASAALCEELNNDAMEWQKEQARRKQAQQLISAEMRTLASNINEVDRTIHGDS